MSERRSLSGASDEVDDSECEECHGVLFRPGECPSCGPARAIRKPDPKISRKLASKDWRSLFGRAREHLGVSDQKESLGVYKLALEFVFRDRIFVDAGTGAILQFEHEESILSEAQDFLVETGRVSHALAAWLGTSSVIPITTSLMTGNPLDASNLKPAQKGTAQDAYMAAMFGLVGRRTPGPYRDYIAAYMDGFGRGAEESGTLETARVNWNRQHPGAKFEPGDAFRKTIERARSRRSKE